MGSDPRTPTAPRVTTGKLSSKILPYLKLSAAFPASIPEGKASTMSWDDHVSAEEGRDLFSGLTSSSILRPFNRIHGSDESAP